MSTVIDVCHCKSTNNLANHQINGQIILELVYYLYLCTRKTYRWFDKGIVIDNEKSTSNHCSGRTNGGRGG